MPDSKLRSTVAPPNARRTFLQVQRVWFISLFIFGYGPAFTYGWLTWLLNERQWFWTYLMYGTLVPFIGGICVIVLPSVWYRPIHAALKRWGAEHSADPNECAAVYQRALELPWRVARAGFAAAFFGYLLGTMIVHWQANQPFIEMIPKTLPAIPLVGGLMGAFCYFGTVRALHDVVAWCSAQLHEPPSVPRVPIGVKFLTTTCVLAFAALCMLLPAAYTLGQGIIEHQLQERALGQLRLVTEHLAHPLPQDDPLPVLREAMLGAHGGVFAIDASGHTVGPALRAELQDLQRRIMQGKPWLQGAEGAWVDRVGEHRVVAFRRLETPPWTCVSIVLPADFAVPLGRFTAVSWIVVAEVLFVVLIFGRYYTKGITIPLAELTMAAERIAQQGDLDQRALVTTNDELSELARSFNRMVEQLQASKADLEDYTNRLERSTRELSALNQEMEDLLHVVSHDLRAPLINIQGFSKRLEPIFQETVQTLERIASESHEDGLRREVETLKQHVEGRFAESLRFISKGVEKMDTLLSLLLAISRVGRKADPIAPHDLNAILDDVLATFDHQLKERSIQVIRHPLPTRVPCRRNEINQVFSNLISNAITYMGATGRRFIEIGAAERADQVECFVKDTGIGIASEDHARVFQMFTRLQAVEAPGEGIGLAYVKKILRSHGGRIWLESARGHGSTFFFTLPLQPLAARG